MKKIIASLSKNVSCPKNAADPEVALVPTADIDPTARKENTNAADTKKNLVVNLNKNRKASQRRK
jgi:hypothetical protein